MDLMFDQSLAKGYTSRSQVIRRLTEAWVEANLFCPRCGNEKIIHFPNNKAVADYYCSACMNEFELKSKGGKIGRKIADGAYDTFIQRITSNRNPDFFILRYHPAELRVDDLWFVPKHFFVPSLVEKRPPLSLNARRAGWVGCNIILDDIPAQGRVPVIQGQTPVPKDVVMEQVQRSSLLITEDLAARGWLLDILNCVNRLPSALFTLEMMYQFEGELKAKHPQNNNVRPKIRQQLQVLRDKGFIEFLGRGNYRVL